MRLALSEFLLPFLLLYIKSFIIEESNKKSRCNSKVCICIYKI